MSDIILRKCGGCSNVIEINRNDITDVCYYKNKYYHAQCFCEIAEKRSNTKRGTAAEWKYALDNLCELKADTKNMLESAWIKDDFNEHLLSNYDIAAVPTRFWQIVADLGNGSYKGKRCKPISMKMLCDEWQWGQRKLNSIGNKNKTSHKGPQNDEARLLYDLAILIQKYPTFLAYKEKQKAEKRDMARITIDNDVDMSRVGQGKQETRKDVSDISDDIFVE